jgi:hypothetical protein
MNNNKLTMTKIYTSFSGRFDGHGNPPVQYGVHLLVEDIQAILEATGHHHRANVCTVSHWRLPGSLILAQKKEVVAKKSALLKLVAKRHKTDTLLSSSK